MYIKSVKGSDATYIGEYQIVSVSGDDWSVANTTVVALSGDDFWIYAGYSRIASTAFSGTGTLVTVTEAGHTKKAGDPVFIEGLTGGTGTWDGHYVVTTDDGDDWTYEATGAGTASGTARVFGDNKIALSATAPWPVLKTAYSPFRLSRTIFL